MLRAKASFDSVSGVEKRSSKGGFTLIEILAVVGIIALLIAVLVPALSAARKNAKATICGVQLEQISLGILMYTQAYRDVLPHLGYRSDKDRILWTWFTQIAPYLRNQYSMYVCPMDDGPDKHSVVLRNGKMRMAGTAEPGSILPVTYRGSCDSMDDGNRWTIAGLTFGPFPRKVTAYQRPSTNILLVEGWPKSQSGQNCFRFDQLTHLLDKVLFADPLWVRAVISFKRHTGRSNFLFADGHVTPHTIEDACKRLPYQQQFRFLGPQS